MAYYNEGTTPFPIDVSEEDFHEIRDFESVHLGAFSSEANALGAQRQANIIKLLIKRKISSEAQIAALFECDFYLDNDDIITLHIARQDRTWHGPSQLSQLLNVLRIKRDRTP